jgi:hypothetical protein
MEHAELIEDYCQGGNMGDHKNKENYTNFQTLFNTQQNVLAAEQAISTVRKNCDYNGMKYVGWNKNHRITGSLNHYFSPETINMISTKITELTRGIDPSGRPIIVPNDRICSVMSDVYDGYRPKTQDIYSRYNVPPSAPENMVQDLINRTIEIIYSDIKTSLGTERNNSKLSIWVTRYGEGNPWGLQQVPTGFAKINHRRETRAVFNMNY